MALSLVQSLTLLPKRNNQGRNPIYFSKRVHMTCLLGLRVWWNLCPREAWVAQYFIYITGLNLVLYLCLLIKSIATYSHWLWAVSVGLSEMEQMSVCGFFRIYLDWNYPSSQQVKSTLITETPQHWLAHNQHFWVREFNLDKDFILGISLSASFTCVFP